MTQTALPAQVVAFLERPIIVHIATMMSDGSPQVTPVWVDTDGHHILVNTAEGRLKVKNVRRNPRVAISAADPDNPYWGSLQVRGTVVEISTAGADAHIDRLARKYTGAQRYQHRAGEVRVILKIKPEKISGGVLGPR